MLAIPENRGERARSPRAFDDGPHSLGTPAVLAALGELRAPAVFFVTGENADRHPGLVREIVAAGHEVGVHGYRHHTRLQWRGRRLDDDTCRALTPSAERRAWRRASTDLRTASSPSPDSDSFVPAVSSCFWSRWGRDWERRATASSIARRASSGVAAGDVLLLHDSDRYAAREVGARRSQRFR